MKSKNAKKGSKNDKVKRNAFAIIECNIVVDNIATNLSPIRFRQFQPSGDFVHIHVIPMEVEVIS